MSEARLKVCVVGAGDMGTKHAERWSNLSTAQVVAVVDIIEERAEHLARVHGLESWFSDYRQAVSLPEVNVVSVCVPTNLHAEVTIFAADKGKHVLCEKSMALTLAQTDAMQSAAEENGIKLGIGFMRPYSPVVDDLRDFLAREKLGRPVMYHATDVREVRPKREMHDVEANGGPIIDMGVHLFDLWSRIFDSAPSSVFAQALTIAKDRPELNHIQNIAYDTAAVTVRYVSGDVGSFVVCWGLPPGVTPSGRADQIFGPSGLVQVQYGMTHQEAQLVSNGGGAETISVSQQDMYQLEIASFAHAILEDRLPKTTAEAGKAALTVALAAIESIQTNQPVMLS